MCRDLPKATLSGAGRTADVVSWADGTGTVPATFHLHGPGGVDDARYANRGQWL